MNDPQKFWWQQAKSDYGLFLILRKRGDVSQCHLLHYLQMATEKLAKAYLWRTDEPPLKSHKGLVRFFRFLLQNCHQKDREHIAKLFGFKTFKHLQNWIKNALTIVYDIERLAPSLANNGANPEYPWPHDRPVEAPVNYSFQVWKDLNNGRGRRLMTIIEIAVKHFEELSDI